MAGVGDVGGRCAGGRRSSLHWYFNGGAVIARDLGLKTDDCKTNSSMKFGYFEVMFNARKFNVRLRCPSRSDAAGGAIASSIQHIPRNLQNTMIVDSY